MNVSAVISYCSLDEKFILPLIREVLKFSDDVIIVHYDKLLNGDIEPTNRVQEIVNTDKDRISSLLLKYTADNSSRYFHNLARWEASKLVKNDYVLFLDADEIPNGDELLSAFSKGLFDNYDAIDFSCYWYFRSASYQATQKEQCGLLIRKNIIKKEYFFTENERWSYRRLRNIKYLFKFSDSNPIFHHFSWARTKSEMLKKVSSWGHMHDKDWKSLIEKEFTHPFSGKDFIHGYSYRIVPDYFNIGI